jgi:uncharacterized protein
MTYLNPQVGSIRIPRVTEISRPFWEAVADHRLTFQRCENCGAAIFNPAPICRFCTSAQLRWEESAGIGSVYSWTVAWRPQSPAFEVPYAPIIVDLAEGYQMISILVNCSVDDVRVGLPVEVVYYEVGDRTLPYFQPTQPKD